MKIRSSAVAGQFYAGDKETLHLNVSQMLDSAESLAFSSTVKGIIAPHAGYIFSGQQAAKAYRQVLGQSFRTVCVISPSHQEYFPFISVYDGDAYQTPLGLVAIDAELRDDSVKFSGVKCSSRGHGLEHALEVQIPFLQATLRAGFQLLPLVMGMQTEETLIQLTDLVSSLSVRYGDEILFVASTDLSHFHGYKHAMKLDLQVVEMLNRLETDRLWKALKEDKVEACGGGPMVGMVKGLLAACPALKIISLGYMNSGDVIPDKGSVVGYTSALLYE